MPETLERIALGSSDTPKYTSERHIATYEFASTRVTKGKTVLDLACDTGYDMERLERASAGKIIGVDYSDEAMHHACTHCGDSRAAFMIADSSRFVFAMRPIQPRSVLAP